MILRLLAIALLAALTPAMAAAQFTVEPAGDEQAPELADPLGRETPRGALTGLLDALGDGNYTRAAEYLDPAALESGTAGSAGAVLARQLQAQLDQRGTLLPYGILSNETQGRLDDDLPPDRERVGTFDGAEGAPILLARGEGSEGEQIWRIADETLSGLDSLATPDAATEPTDETLLVGGAPLADWALLLGIAAGTFFLCWLISAALLLLLRSLVAEPEKHAVYRVAFAALPPLSLFLAVAFFQLWAGSIEASIIARQTLLRYVGLVGWVALAWFALRLVDAIARVATARMERSERRQAISIVALLRRAAKVLLLALVVVAVLDTFGFDVTTGIAALGIGGLALALGAQKTIENLVGSVTVLADRPVQVGDFCRVGDVIGTVEDIGMRSTRVRTLERTLVTIPNGDFASREIENYAKRDRFLFNPTIGVEYGISAAKLREGIEIIEQVLRDHPLVENEGLRARLAHFGASALEIELWSYIIVEDFAESRRIRQELLLSIFERLERAGLAIAFPTQKVHLVQDRE